MKQMSWEDYYDGFYDWSSGTQKSHACRLSGYGPAEEVWEVAQELELEDSSFAVEFLEKAFDAGVRYAPEQVVEMVGAVDQRLLSKFAEQTDIPFNREQLEEIYLMIDESSFRKISQRAKIHIFDDVGGTYEPPVQKAPEKPRKGGGLFAALTAALIADALLGRGRKKAHPVYCNGDCARCPPHYGYRYGRWHYGRGHHHGCEFGGNRGDGGL